MGHRNGSFAALAILLSALALSSMVCTDAYSQAAQSEASGYDALTHEVARAALLCLHDTVVDAAVQPMAAP